MGTLTVILAIVSQLINQEQPQPYMVCETYMQHHPFLKMYSTFAPLSFAYKDEIFHIPQVQQYCLHNFSHWDNMITTLPGL